MYHHWASITFNIGHIYFYVTILILNYVPSFDEYKKNHCLPLPFEVLTYSIRGGVQPPEWQVAETDIATKVPHDVLMG